MASRTDDYITQLNGLKTLSELTTDTEHSTDLSRALVCRLAASAMQHFPLDRDMQVQAMRALHDCPAMHRGPRVLGLMEGEACSLVAEAMETFIHDVHAQRNGLAAMRTLISPKDPETEYDAAEEMMDMWDQMVENGAADLIAASMRTHAEDAEVVSHALHVMGYLSQSAKAVHPIVQSDWVELVGGALQAFAKDAVITYVGVGVLTNLAANAASLDHFHEAGAWTSASAAMKQHKAHANVQHLCLVLVTLLAEHQGLRWQLGEDVACDAVLTSMRAVERDLKVQLAGLGAMGSLCDDYTTFMQGGNSSEVSNVTTRHPWLAEVRQDADKPGGNSRTYIVPDNAPNPHGNRIRFVEGGGVDVVAAAMRRFPEDPNVQVRAVRVLALIGKNVGGPSYAVCQLVDKAVERFGGDEGWRYSLRVDGQRAKDCFSGRAGRRPGM